LLYSRGNTFEYYLEIDTSVSIAASCNLEARCPFPEEVKVFFQFHKLQNTPDHHTAYYTFGTEGSLQRPRPDAGYSPTPSSEVKNS
jgi:hypothetical protein